MLVFSHTVADGDSDTDGLEIEANQLALNGGTIKDAADNDALLDHQAVAADTSHRVDGVKPGLAATGGAVVNLATLTLTYDEPLDGNSMPPAVAFTVSGGNQTRTVTDVAVSGSAVELTLDSAVESRRDRRQGELQGSEGSWDEPDPGCRRQRRGGAEQRGGDE